ncbi:hypothetical protein VPH35_136518 [Triticum aestivum]
MDKGKEVVPPLEKGKEVVPPLEKGKEVVPPLVEGQGGRAAIGRRAESLPMPLEFMKHFPAVPTEFELKTNTGCWVTLNQGWATFTAVHQIMIGCMLTFELLTPDTMKVIVFNDDGVEVVTKCKEHENAFVVTA